MATTRKKRTPGQAVLTYMTANADKTITLDELEENITDFDRSQISGAAGNAVASKRHPQFQRVAWGCYRWSSAPVATPPEPLQATEMLVTVVRSKDDGTMLVRDESTLELFVMKPFEF